MQRKYLEEQHRREDEEEKRKALKLGQEKAEVMKMLESQVEERRRTQEMVKSRDRQLAERSKIRAQEYADEVVEQKRAEWAKNKKHRDELMSQIEENKKRVDMLAGMTTEEFKMNKARVTRAERLVS